MKQHSIGRLIVWPRRAMAVLMSLSVLSMTACAATAAIFDKAPAKPRTVPITITAADQLNPDVQGRPSPVTVRVYQLKTPTAFAAADFFALFDRDSALLAADLNMREVIQLTPGQKMTLTREINTDTKQIAVLVAYRDIERATWRATADVMPSAIGPVTVKVDALAVSINAQMVK